MNYYAVGRGNSADTHRAVILFTLRRVLSRLARLSRSVGRPRAVSQGGSLAERFGLRLAESRGDHGHHRLSGHQGDPDLPPTVRCVWNEPMDFFDDPQRMDMRGLTVLQLLTFVVYEEAPRRRRGETGSAA